MFVTSETNITNQIPVEFFLARGDTRIHTTSGIANQLIVGVAVSVVAVVITALAIISVVICIACVCYKKQVRKIEIELQTVQLNPSYGQATQPNPSYGQINPATQPNDGIVGTDDGQYETVKDYEVVV